MTTATQATDTDFDFGDVLDGIDSAIEAPAPSPQPKPEPVKFAAANPPAKPTSTRHRATMPAGTLVFDLETAPDYSREELFGLPPIPTPAVYSAENDGPVPSKLVEGTEEAVKAAVAKSQSGGKMLPRIILESALAFEQKKEKPRKGVTSLFSDMISAIDNEATRIQAATEARRKTMSVTPEMNRIVAFGYAWGDDPTESMVYRRVESIDEQWDRDEFERQCLRKFWDFAKRAKLIVGFNVLGFDLPTIFMRSMLLGVAPTKILDLKPWGSDVCDIMAKLWPKGGQKKLKDFSRSLGIPVPAGDVDGSQVEELLKNPEKLGEYVRSDVSITREIYLYFRGFYWN